jgi:hypothetical protein
MISEKSLHRLDQDSWGSPGESSWPGQNLGSQKKDPSRSRIPFRGVNQTKQTTE